MLLLPAVLFLVVQVVPLPDGCPDPVQYPDAVCITGEETPAPPSPTPKPSGKPPKRGKPKVELTTDHRMLQDPLYGQPPVMLRVTIINADEKYWCPQIVWTWPNGTESRQEGDCVPYEQASPEDLARKSFSKQLPMLLPPGQWTIKATLRKSEKNIITVETSILVSGGG